MISAITNGVKVSVKTEYQPYYSNVRQMSHVFSYKIRIENCSDQTVQLLRRHWYIVDSNGYRREVEGDGVIGEQPVIEPGEFHEYVSGCNLTTPIGKMHGTYLMEKVLDGERFEVLIPEFYMMVPYIQN